MVGHWGKLGTALAALGPAQCGDCHGWTLQDGVWTLEFADFNVFSSCSMAVRTLDFIIIYHCIPRYWSPRLKACFSS